MRGWRLQAPASNDCERDLLIMSAIEGFLGGARDGPTPHIIRRFGPPSPARGEGVARAPGFTPRGGLAALAASCRPAAARSRRPDTGCARDRCAASPRSARPPRHARPRARAISPEKAMLDAEA